MKNKMMKLRDRQARGGFTIIEVLVAICILVVGILTVATLQITAISGNKLGSEVTGTANVAQGKFEELMALQYTVDFTDPDLGGSIAGITHNDPAPPPGYAISWTVTNDVPVNNSKSIAITVTWQNRTRTTLNCIKAR